MKSLVINCTSRNCHGVCNKSESSRMVVSWYVWHQTKKSSCLGPLSCRVACCRVVSHMCELSFKPSSHIGDTTRHDSMRHDPFFRSPYNQMDQFTHAARQCLVVTIKSCGEAIFVVCRSDSIKKTAKENSFHRNLTLVYKFMMQE